MFTPLMTYAALLNTLSSYERQYGAATFSVRGQAMVKGHEAIAFDDLFSTGQSAMDASAYIVAPLTYLLGNDFEKVEVSRLDLTIGSTEEPKTATPQRVDRRSGVHAPVVQCRSRYCCERTGARTKYERCRSRFRPMPAAPFQ
jgi:hypothetical protein